MVRMPLLWLLVAVAAGIGVLLVSAAGDDSNPPPEQGTAPATRPETARPHHPPDEERAGSTHAQVREAVSENPPATLHAQQRAVVRVVRAYVSALDVRDGAKVCRQFASNALDGVRLPRDRGDCAASLSASIGYRDPRGFPVFRGARVARITNAAVDGTTARVTATTVTRFAGNRQPSVEDDVVYLTRAGRRWVIAKPSAELYRAIGAGQIPPSAFSPP